MDQCEFVVGSIRVVATNAMKETMGTERASLAKVLIVGATNVGKTSLVNSLVFGGFTEVKPTIGVNFAQIICYGEAGPINLSIWDLSGHKRFRCLMPRFCQGATGVVLVFDVTTPESLKAASHWLEFISYWNTARKNFTAILAGTKTDLQLAISQKNIQAFCIQHQIPNYVACSAKTGKNVKHVFNTLCSAMQRNKLELLEHNPGLVSSSKPHVGHSLTIKW